MVSFRQLRDVARMATITRLYSHDIDWPKELTADEDEDICRLFMLVGQVEDMAKALVETYDSAFERADASAEIIGRALACALFMRHNNRVEQRNTSTSPSLLNNIPYLWWIICPLEACRFIDWACGQRGQVLNDSARF